MKIRTVEVNKRRKCFEVHLRGKMLCFPFAKASPRPTKADPIESVAVDPELGNEGFTYELRSGAEGTIHVDHVLNYNRDPSYMRDLALYKLTLEVQKRVKGSGLSKREIIRRLGTSATQFYRLIDQTNYRKSIDQLLRLLSVLDCDVEFVVHSKCA